MHYFHSTPILSHRRSSGFVMLTVMILLALLSLLSVSQLYRAITNQQESGASVMSMRATYYAETAISYIEWSWANDADFDASLNAGEDQTIGDREEWLTQVTSPGNIKYWDNSILNSTRAVCWPTSLCGGSPDMYRISANLPRYIILDIDQNSGAITPSISSAVHSIVPVIGTDIPNNGAVVWLTAGDEDNDYPKITAANCTLPTAQDAGCLVDPYSYYHVVAYAVSYVNGQALHLLRAIIQ